MTSEKPPDRPPGSTHRNLIGGAWRQASIQIVAALAAYAVTIALVSFAPLLTALAATLTFAAAWLHGGRDAAAKSDPAVPGTALGLYTAIFTTAGVLLGAWMIAVVIGSSGAFYCGPAIPWRIEIAFFGSFTIGILTRMAHARKLARLAYPLILLALFWIAPFYGYFSGPVFVALALITDCANRPIIQVCLAALGMGAGNVIGNMLAVWLLATRDERDGSN